MGRNKLEAGIQPVLTQQFQAVREGVSFRQPWEKNMNLFLPELRVRM